MFSHLIKKKADESGQAVIEFAITLPILLVILGGIIDFGWIFTNQNIIDHCAREGARYAVVNAGRSNAGTLIENYTRSLAPSNVADSLAVNVTFTNTSKPELGDVIVDVSRQIDMLTPVAGVFVRGQQLSLDSSCRMKAE